MFFKLHQEGKIGYKKLSEADLGLGRSHQTHIGLFGDIFTFLSDREVEEEALLIHNNEINFVDCYFDRINRKNGDVNAPKIKTGGRNSVSVVTIIRDKAKEKPNQEWHLIWFGLENEKMVFYFFNNDSIDYMEISNIIDLSKKRSKIEKSSPKFRNLLNYLENKIDANGENIFQELEVISQMESPTKRYGKIDIEKANKIFQETGKLGEELVANYLDYLKSKNQIFNFTWYNQSRETGLPYDFTIQDNTQNIIHIDAKSTSYQFEQPMIFSSQEIEFIKDIPNYNIYRVFDIGNKSPKLRICEQSKNLANLITPYIEDFDSKLKSQDIQLRSTKMAINPTNDLLIFNKKVIDLNFK